MIFFLLEYKFFLFVTSFECRGSPRHFVCLFSLLRFMIIKFIELTNEYDGEILTIKLFERDTILDKMYYIQKIYVNVDAHSLSSIYPMRSQSYSYLKEKALW